MTMHFLPSPFALGVVALAIQLLASQAFAQSTESEPETIQITVTRTQSRAKETPASVDTRSAADIERAGAQVNVSEALAGIPGVVANNRGNYAQDVQLSTRGFGARTAFGVRGVRVVIDGIPGNSPDGQAQVSHVDLSSAQSIEVLRGPFSALYGNASGGVLLVNTEAGGKETLSSTNLYLGSDGLQRVGQKLSGTAGAVNYVLSASRFAVDGWRDHSEAKKTQANARLGIQLAPDTHAVITANTVNMPNAQDPQGVTAAGLTTPRAVVPAVLQFDTRKSTQQSQWGMDLQHKFNAEHALKLALYSGSRSITQFQSTPVAAQTAATAAGGVVDLDRAYRGWETRYTWRSPGTHGPSLVHVGIASDRMSEERRGFENFIGASLGVQGKLRRDETNTLSSTAYYVQGQWWATSSTALHAGWRSNRLKLVSEDHYIATGNPNDSGSVSYQGSTPVLGLLQQLSKNTSVYASWGRGFDTPTMNEVAYNANAAASGLNLTLLPSRSKQFELGVKWALQPGAQLNLAYFEAKTQDEIAVLSNSSGRSRFQNVGNSQRSGVELGFDGKLAQAWQTRASVSSLNANYSNAFLSCYITTCSPTGTGANAPRLVAAGSRIPGAARVNAFAQVLWRPKAGGIEASVDWRASGKTPVDDLNTEHASGYAVVGARVALRQTLGRWSFAQSLRVDNLLNKAYIGSVIVNQASSQFYEPGQGRNWLVGLNATYKF